VRDVFTPAWSFVFIFIVADKSFLFLFAYFYLFCYCILMSSDRFPYDRTLREIFLRIPLRFIEIFTHLKVEAVLDPTFPRVTERRADFLSRVDLTFPVRRTLCRAPSEGGNPSWRRSFFRRPHDGACGSKIRVDRAFFHLTARGTVRIPKFGLICTEPPFLWRAHALSCAEGGFFSRCWMDGGEVFGGHTAGDSF